MRIAVLSDMHLNFYLHPSYVLNPLLDLNFDLFISAGDMIPAVHFFNPLQWLSDNKIKTVYVPGNHDYYHSSLSSVNKEFLNKEYEYVSILNNKLHK